MPCWTRTEISIDAGKMNAARLQATIDELSLSGYASLESGRLSIRARSDAHAAEIKQKILQGYAAATIKEASRRFGWTVKKQATTTAGNIQINLGRR